MQEIAQRKSGDDKPCVLVVEDEWLIALDLTYQLEEAGCACAGPARSVSAALALLDAHPVAAGLLDVNLDGEDSFPVAQALAARRIPFAFLSGYTRSEVDISAFGAAAMISKPVATYELHALLATLLNSRG